MPVPTGTASLADQVQRGRHIFLYILWVLRDGDEYDAEAQHEEGVLNCYDVAGVRHQVVDVIREKAGVRHFFGRDVNRWAKDALPMFRCLM